MTGFIPYLMVYTQVSLVILLSGGIDIVRQHVGSTYEGYLID